MYSVDFQNQLNDYLLDEGRKIPAAHLKSVCKKDQKDACRYICLCQIGFVCMKKSPAKKQIDGWANTKIMSARADNCEGLGEGYEKN